MTDEISSGYSEASADPKSESAPLAHVSIELGHLYLEDFAGGPDVLNAMFANLVPWVRAAMSRESAGEPKGSARMSTCFLIDDYFSPFSAPAEVIPMVLDAAAKAGLQIDYLARESACASTRDRRPAELLLHRLVSEPAPGTTGGRPPVTESGWLSNGVRSPASPAADEAPVEAMHAAEEWRPPRQNAARRHSVFIDVELWYIDSTGRRVWSCAMLAAVWQAIRLGLLRDHGRQIVTPADAPAQWPDAWADLPPVIRLEPRAMPFAAYTTVSLLSPRFVMVEAAVRNILSQFAPDPGVLAATSTRADDERVELPEELVDRIRYGFVGSGRSIPA